MDVVKAAVAVPLMVLGLLLSGCSGTKTADSVMTSASSQCGGQTMENRFIVQWEDGSFSVESGKSKDEFRDSFVTQKFSSD